MTPSDKAPGEPADGPAKETRGWVILLTVWGLMAALVLGCGWMGLVVWMIVRNPAK